MSIIYVYTFDDPSGVGPIPPTFLGHPQGDRLHKAVNSLPGAINCHSGKSVMFFENESELVKWVEENRITDPELLADIELWNKAHNIVHHHNYYSATLLPIPVTPVF